MNLLNINNYLFMSKHFLNACLLMASIGLVSCSNDAANNTNTDVPAATETVSNTTVTNEAPQNTMPVTQVEIAEAMHDFGTVKEGVKLMHVFKIKNVGKEPYLIADAKPSCGCTVPSFSKKPVLPGETAEIEIEFDTKGRLGNNIKEVSVSSNADQEIKLSFKAEVVK